MAHWLWTRGQIWSEVYTSMRRDKNKEKIDYLKVLEKGWLDQIADKVLEEAGNLSNLNTKEIWMTMGKIKAARLVLR